MTQGGLARPGPESMDGGDLRDAVDRDDANAVPKRQVVLDDGELVEWAAAEFLPTQRIRRPIVTNAVHVRERGTMTLPAEIRRRYGIQTGDAFELVDLDGIFLLTPMAAIVPELAREIERARLEAGLTTEDLLRSLREERERYVTEKYGAAAE